jgi:hypothetical protein
MCAVCAVDVIPDRWEVRDVKYKEYLEMNDQIFGESPHLGLCGRWPLGVTLRAVPHIVFPYDDDDDNDDEKHERWQPTRAKGT